MMKKKKKAKEWKIYWLIMSLWKHKHVFDKIFSSRRRFSLKSFQKMQTGERRVKWKKKETISTIILRASESESSGAGSGVRAQKMITQFLH